MADVAVALEKFVDLSEALELAKDVVRTEADELFRLSDRLDVSICHAAVRIAECSGIVHVTGMGKAGIVGQKIAATMASLGIRAFFLHPAEAVHGDMGRVAQGDVVLALSQSGETEELLRFVTAIRPVTSQILALTHGPSNPLGRLADQVISIGEFVEACPMGLAPTTSTTLMMSLGDALSVLAARYRGIMPIHFAANHPAGKLGRRLSGVDRIMRTGRHVRLAKQDEIVRDVLLRQGGARRRSGAILVVDPIGGSLVGIFTDSDLVRLLERGRAFMLDRPIGESMTTHPTVIDVRSTVADAVEALRSRKLSELPVVDESGVPVGLVDVTDLIGLVPTDFDEEAAA
jgi:arabinose-5-phosphate isomerase